MILAKTNVIAKVYVVTWSSVQAQCIHEYNHTHNLSGECNSLLLALEARKDFRVSIYTYVELPTEIFLSYPQNHSSLFHLPFILIITSTLSSFWKQGSSLDICVFILLGNKLEVSPHFYSVSIDLIKKPVSPRFRPLGQIYSASQSAIHPTYKHWAPPENK